MNENIDLAKILKNCPNGWEFWSPIFGVVEFDGIFNAIVFVNEKEYNESWSFYPDATLAIGNIKSVEIMLYPSEDQRDWSKFTAPWYKKERFDPKTLKPFDKVLVRDNYTNRWRCTFFSHFIEGINFPCNTVSSNYKQCIPYNNETKHLIGTTDEAPEYYRYWED